MAVITENNIGKFIKLYNEAKKKNETEFMFLGQPVLMSYAKYVIEYFNMMQAEKNIRNN